MFKRLGIYFLVMWVCLFLGFQRVYAAIPYLTGKNGVVELEMEARPVGIELRPGIYFDAWGYCLKGQMPAVPGPTIKVREGTKLRIHLTNKLTVPASVHPHGVKYTIANDGAHIAGNPTSIVEPGNSRIFEWDTTGTPGTWFYHTHAFERGGEEGLYRGLWGALIVEPKEGDPNPPDKEFVVFMHTFKVNGAEYNTFNDKSADMEFMKGDSSAFPGVVWRAKMGEKVRFHLINSSEEVHTFHTHGHRWVDQASGHLIDNIGLVPFTSYVLEFVAGEGVGPGNWSFHCHFFEHMMAGMSGVFVVEEADAKKPTIKSSPPLEGANENTQSSLKSSVPTSEKGAEATSLASSPEIPPPTLGVPQRSFTYPEASLKKMYEEFVGLKQGDGPWGDVYKPIAFYKYFNPARHYSPPDSPYYKELVKKYKASQCVECHEEVTPGVVTQWKRSNHANTKKDTETARETKEIEELIGKKIDPWTPGTKNGVYCSYCHGQDHEHLYMPTADNSCGVCHPKQAREFAKGRDYGKPNHPQSWEGSVSTPWYAENYRRGEGTAMVGCDQCHQNMSSCDDCHFNHRFSSAEARRPEVCAGCHMGPDHPDWESYEMSKWGILYHTTGDKWDWEKKLSQVVPGQDYQAPTCQYCHMYVGDNRWEMNVETKGIWRMGLIPPEGVEFKSRLKDFPYGVKIPPMDKKLEIYSSESKRRRQLWVELCARCHSNSFSSMWLDALDQYMFTAWKRLDRAQQVLEEVFANNLVQPTPKARPPFPLWELMVQRLGSEKLGPKLYELFKETSGHLPVIGPVLGAYGIFTQANGNPSLIEREYVEMWFWQHLQGYKGTAHAQQDISWWWGTAQTMGKLTRIQAEARKLRDFKALQEALQKTNSY